MPIRRMTYAIFMGICFFALVPMMSVPALAQDDESFPVADIDLPEFIAGFGVGFNVPEDTLVRVNRVDGNPYFSIMFSLDEGDTDVTLLIGTNNFIRFLTDTRAGDDIATTFEGFTNAYNNTASAENQLDSSQLISGTIGANDVRSFRYMSSTEGYFLLIALADSDVMVAFDTNSESLTTQTIEAINAIANSITLTDEVTVEGAEIPEDSTSVEAIDTSDATDSSDTSDAPATEPIARSGNDDDNNDNDQPLVELGIPDIDLINTHAFPSGMTNNYPVGWDILSKTDTVTILWYDNSPVFVQLYDLGSLFGGTDLGFDFIKETYGDSAANAWQDDKFDPLTSFDDVLINGNEAAVYTFVGQQDGEVTTVWLYLINFGEGNYGMVQAYAIGEPPENYKLDVQAIAVSMRAE